MQKLRQPSFLLHHLFHLDIPTKFLSNPANQLPYILLIPQFALKEIDLRTMLFDLR